jgi:sirohydrochlorin cobaltochelatase
MTAPHTGIVLFAHGSRDPLWRTPIDAVAQAMATQSPGCEVRCAFLELTAPDLPSAVDELAALGLRCVRVVPMFLGVGRHAREDLPILVAQLREQHPNLAIELMPSVGEHPAMTQLMAKIALGAGPNP